MGLSSFKDILPKVLQKISVTPHNYALLSAVEKEVSSVSSGARIVGFKNNKIYIEVESSVHLHEFTFKRKEILKVVKAALPSHGSLNAEPELKFFIKGTARASRQERLTGTAVKTFRRFN